MRRAFVFVEDVRGGGVLLFLLIALGVCFPYYERIREANERPRLMQSMALIDDGSFAIDGPGGRGLDTGPDVSRGQGSGRLYPNKPPGASIVGAASYVVATVTHAALDRDLTLRALTGWTRVFGSLLPTLVLCGFLLRKYAPAFGRGPATLAVVLYALATPASSYAHLFYGHQLAACLLVVGMELVCSGQRHARIGLSAAGGVLAACAVVVEYGAVFAAIPLGVFLISAARHRGGAKRLGVAVAAACVPILLLAAYHQTAFGSPWSTGYHNVTSAAFAHKHGQGLLGLGWPTWTAFSRHFLSLDGGLLWWAPLFPVALLGLAQLSASRATLSAEARLHLATFLLFGLVSSSLVFEGGWRVGPRYMVAVLPLLALGWAHVLAQLRTEARWMVLVIVVATYSVVLNVLAGSLWPHFDLTNINQPLAEVLLPLFDAGYEPYNLARPLVGLHGTWFVVVFALVGLVYGFARCVEHGVRGLGALVFGVFAGLLLIPMSRVVPDHPQGARNLAYIQRIWEPVGDAGTGERPSFILVRHAPAALNPKAGGKTDAKTR